MLSDETISNFRLHRTTLLESNAKPFVVPTNGQLHVPVIKHQPPVVSERATSLRTSKSIIDAKNRAVSDSCMAAAIGDLQWLKQSLRDGPLGSGEAFTIEQTYGKDGLAPIHLAAVHGRLNCLSYLIEIVHIDIDLPSITGWRPIHLCISKETGSRSFQCLQYLVEKGAQINITNNDQLTPLHQAASEGHVQCVEFLLARNADVYAEDSRKQSPLDLAKLWGHKRCAKLLAAAMWHQNKHLSEKERLLTRNSKMADILLEIKQEHANLFEEKGEEKFDQWLVNAGTGSGALNKTSKDSNPTGQQKQSENQKTLPEISSENVNNQKSSLDKRFIPKRTRPPTYVNNTKWNVSTHAKPNPYITDLVDAYPRDPFTKMPPKQDAAAVYQLLQSMTLTDVKKFLERRQGQITEPTISDEPQKKQRPVVYAPCHVHDIQTLHKPRKGDESYQPLRYFDEAGLHMTNNVRKNVFYNQLSEALNEGENTFLSRHQATEDRTKWALFEQYGSELIDFLTDHRGRFKRQYEKVFIT
ncbi:unnamed protein product [Adineta steineri]|uniref:Ankyrin repeat domain-containing protein 53 n=1 Tax=Adineta steineri TaxID=433720 RepID=A0A815HVT5_9BILA|nr:unnamed protein product [Adineta steineri]CAF1359162.1 unnamed protein product [Adineta steineri]